jgi:hypothetical protein
MWNGGQFGTNTGGEAVINFNLANKLSVTVTVIETVTGSAHQELAI